MRKALKYALWILLVLLILLAIWGFIEPYFVDVEAEVAPIPGLPAAWEGQQVAQISDFQIGMWGDNEPTVRRIVARIVEEAPALALITGDFIYHPGEKNPSEEIRTAVALVRPLTEAGIPTFAVLGNHDYNMADPEDSPDVELARKVEAALEEIGVDVLENAAVPLHGRRGTAESSAAAAPLYVVGIGSSWAGRARPGAAVAGIPEAAPRVVMMHNPNAFEGLPPGSAPLAVAGHTHGGQVRLPGFPEWSWLTFVYEDEIHADGWIEEYGAPGNRLYVNRGIGFGVAPIRINCMPELTLFTLERRP